MGINNNPMIRHQDHQTQIRPGRGPHRAMYWCTKCNMFIAWVARDDLKKLLSEVK
jgi:hypothetical protein